MRIALRIRTSPEKKIVRSRRPNRQMALGAASLLWPLALCCFLACAWRWSSDLGWTGSFPVSGGLCSHWQIWFVAGGLLHVLAIWLAHYAEPSRPETPANADPHAPATAPRRRQLSAGRHAARPV